MSAEHCGLLADWHKTQLKAGYCPFGVISRGNMASNNLMGSFAFNTTGGEKSEWWVLHGVTDTTLEVGNFAGRLLCHVLSSKFVAFLPFWYFSTRKGLSDPN